MAYRSPEQPPGWTATRRAISLLPSSTRSSFTLPAALSLSWIIGPPVHGSVLGFYRLERSTIRPERRFLQLHPLGPGAPLQLGGAGPEDRVRRPGGGPHVLVDQEVPVQEGAQPRRMPEGGCPPNREAGGASSLLRAR